MRHLECVILRENDMSDNLVSNMKNMIINNKDLKILVLPNLALSQANVKIIVQALKCISSLHYVDLNINKIDNELAKDVALLFTNNSELVQLHVAKLTLDESGFKHLKGYLARINGLKLFSIKNCVFNSEDSDIFASIIQNNPEIQSFDMVKCSFTETDHISLLKWDQLRNLSNLNLSNSSIIGTIVNKLIINNSKLNSLVLCNCELQCNEILEALKSFQLLTCADLSGNTMTDNAFIDVELIIINNKQLQQFCLPNCVLKNRLLKVVFDAMIDHSSFSYIDLGNNQVNGDLIYDLAIIIYKNPRLQQLHLFKLVLNQTEFNHLKDHLNRIRSLNYLSVIDCKLTEEDSNYIATVAANNCITLKELNLSGCKFNMKERSLQLIAEQLTGTCTFKY